MEPRLYLEVEKEINKDGHYPYDRHQVYLTVGYQRYKVGESCIRLMDAKSQASALAYGFDSLNIPIQDYVNHPSGKDN